MKTEVPWFGGEDKSTVRRQSERGESSSIAERRGPDDVPRTGREYAREGEKSTSHLCYQVKMYSKHKIIFDIVGYKCNQYQCVSIMIPYDIVCILVYYSAFVTGCVFDFLYQFPLE